MFAPGRGLTVRLLCSALLLFCSVTSILNRLTQLLYRSCACACTCTCHPDQHSDETLEAQVPGLVFSFGEAHQLKCPRDSCGYQHSLREVDQLWAANSHVYTVPCAACGQFFVPRFTVERGCRDGETAPAVLWCELLSPWVLRKEVMSVLKDWGVDVLTGASFRSTHPVVFWNIIVACRLRGLPYAFLLREEGEAGSQS